MTTLHCDRARPKSASPKISAIYCLSRHSPMAKGAKGDRKAEKAEKKRSKPADGDLDAQLAALGLAAKDVLGDGNCLFRSLSDQLNGNPNDHAKLRAQTVAHMRENPDLYVHFIDVDVDAKIGRKSKIKGTGDERTSNGFRAYLERMARDGVYAGNLELVAFSRLSGRDIVVHQAAQPPWIVHCSDTGSSASGSPLHIVYLDYEHYQSVRPLAGTTKTGPAVDLKKPSAAATKKGKAGKETTWTAGEGDGTWDAEEEGAPSHSDPVSAKTDENLGSITADDKSPDEEASAEPLSPPEPAKPPTPPRTKPEKRPSKAQLKEAKKKAQKLAALEKKKDKNSGSSLSQGNTGKGAADAIDALVGGIKAVVI